MMQAWSLFLAALALHGAATEGLIAKDCTKVFQMQTYCKYYENCKWNPYYLQCVENPDYVYPTPEPTPAPTKGYSPAPDYCAGGTTKSLCETWIDCVWNGQLCTDAPPTNRPTFAPSESPTEEPTSYPTNEPTMAPTNSAAPTQSPTMEPTFPPTLEPTALPTDTPTKKPSHHPTLAPSKTPTKHPTKSPSKSPTTAKPTKKPTLLPTASPASPPTPKPTLEPSKSPTTANPTKSPTRFPTLFPTKSPTTESPTLAPTLEPTLEPTTPSPTKYPTTPAPTSKPTSFPTAAPIGAESALNEEYLAQILQEDAKASFSVRYAFSLAVSIEETMPPMVVYLLTSDYYYDHTSQRTFQNTLVAQSAIKVSDTSALVGAEKNQTLQKIQSALCDNNEKWLTGCFILDNPTDIPYPADPYPLYLIRVVRDEFFSLFETKIKSGTFDNNTFSLTYTEIVGGMFNMYDNLVTDRESSIEAVTNLFTGLTDHLDQQLSSTFNVIGSIKPNPCQVKPCSGRGLCSISQKNTDTCLCDSNYNGDRCELSATLPDPILTKSQAFSMIEKNISATYSLPFALSKGIEAQTSLNTTLNLLKNDDFFGHSNKTVSFRLKVLLQNVIQIPTGSNLSEQELSSLLAQVRATMCSHHSVEMCNVTAITSARPGSRSLGNENTHALLRLVDQGGFAYLLNEEGFQRRPTVNTVLVGTQHVGGLINVESPSFAEADATTLTRKAMERIKSKFELQNQCTFDYGDEVAPMPCHFERCSGRGKCEPTSNYKEVCNCFTNFTGNHCEFDLVKRDDNNPGEAQSKAPVIIGSTGGALFFLFCSLLGMRQFKKWKSNKEGQRRSLAEPGSKISKAVVPLPHDAVEEDERGKMELPSPLGPTVMEVFEVKTGSASPNMPARPKNGPAPPRMPQLAEISIGGQNSVYSSNPRHTRPHAPPQPVLPSPYFSPPNGSGFESQYAFGIGSPDGRMRFSAHSPVREEPQSAEISTPGDKIHEHPTRGSSRLSGSASSESSVSRSRSRHSHGQSTNHSRLSEATSAESLKSTRRSSRGDSPQNPNELHSPDSESDLRGHIAPEPSRNTKKSPISLENDVEDIPLDKEEKKKKKKSKKKEKKSKKHHKVFAEPFTPHSPGIESPNSVEELDATQTIVPPVDTQEDTKRKSKTSKSKSKNKKSKNKVLPMAEEIDEKRAGIQIIDITSEDKKHHRSKTNKQNDPKLAFSESEEQTELPSESLLQIDKKHELAVDIPTLRSPKTPADPKTPSVLSPKTPKTPHTPASPASATKKKKKKKKAATTATGTSPSSSKKKKKKKSAHTEQD